MCTFLDRKIPSSQQPQRYVLQIRTLPDDLKSPLGLFLVCGQRKRHSLVGDALGHHSVGGRIHSGCWVASVFCGEKYLVDVRRYFVTSQLLSLDVVRIDQVLVSGASPLSLGGTLDSFVIADLVLPFGEKAR